MSEEAHPINLPLLVSPSDFSEYLQKEAVSDKLCVVDLSSEANFIQGHIPGAVFLPYQSLISGHPPAPGKLPSIEQLQNIFDYLAIEADTHFVVCDDEGGGWAGRFIWTLDVIGHKNYSYIDGGMIAWKAEALPIESGQSKKRLPPSNPVPIKVDRSPIADIDTILQGIEKNHFTIWDARSPEEFNGIRLTAAKGGHIPGAINVEWTRLMDPAKHYKIRDDIDAFLQQQGIDGSLPIITHCQTHHRSGFTYLVGKILGYDIRAYDGSWSEWGNHPNTPVEKV